MTISYAGEVPNGSSFGCFWRILLKWRGSVYKLVWRELLAYLFFYYSLNLVYRYALNDHQQRVFEKIRSYCGKQSESIPMSFVLGFYVTLVVGRWWKQYRLLPWPDTLALFISAAIQNNPSGNNETGRLMRRNIMRYMVLAYVITLQRISLRVKRRFPTAQHLVDAGLMMESEMKIFEIMNTKSPMSKYWMPLVWATNIINRARRDGLIASDHIVQTILMELSDIRRRLGALIGFDTVCVPLVYTQVVTLVLYSYFIAALMGRQMVPNSADSTDKYEDPDLYFPLFTALQFVFYVGWLKVAEVLINPFGEDDDDIELNWLIDRHIKAAYMIVDEMHEEHPELLKDQYWEEVVPKDLPYTVASEHYRRSEPKGSAETYKVKASDALYANIMPAKRNLTDDVYADYESVDTPMVERRKNWFTRQITRMGSVRSSSTAYSSGGGGLFNRNRLNSVYSSPEAGLPLANQPSQKMSLYDKFVNRKSLRAQRQLMKQNSKLNLNGNVTTVIQKNRPRIPTPDVTKESIEKENRMNLAVSNINNSSNNNSNIPGSNIASGVALMAHQLSQNSAMYPQAVTNQDVPVLGTLLLSPIKEMDSNSAHNTLQAGHPTTAALAQAVLPKALQNSGFGGKVNNQISTTLSIPFTVSTTSAALTTDSGSTPGTLSIVSMVPSNSSLNQISTGVAQGGFDTTDVVSLASIPISVSVAKPTSSDITITEIPTERNENFLSPSMAANHNNLDVNQDNEKEIMFKDLSGTNSHSRQSSINESIRDSYILERKYSERSSKLQDHNNSNIHNEEENSNDGVLKTHSLENSVSAPSTLTKRKPETKTGEVYV